GPQQAGHDRPLVRAAFLGQVALDHEGLRAPGQGLCDGGPGAAHGVRVAVVDLPDGPDGAELRRPDVEVVQGGEAAQLPPGRPHECPGMARPRPPGGGDGDAHPGPGRQAADDDATGTTRGRDRGGRPPRGDVDPTGWREAPAHLYGGVVDGEHLRPQHGTWYTKAMNAEGVVAGFIAALERGDIDGAMGFMAPDCEYDNVPMSKAVGHEQIRGVL